MYDWLPEVCRGLRENLVDVYWLAIGPLTTFLICLQLLNLDERSPNAVKILQRTLISMLLLVSFDEVMHLISFVGDGIVHAISPKPHINQVLDEVWGFVQGMEVSWHKYKQTIIWMFSLMSFVFAYLGAFIADALVQFCWALLYVLSPLMILAYIPERTSGICKGLYQSMCTVMAWKVLWACLGAILLKFTVNAPIAEGDNYNGVLLIVINLFIGLSLLFIPFTTKAFLSGDFSGYTAGLSMAPALAGKAVVVNNLRKAGGFAVRRSKHGINYGFKATGNSYRNVRSRFSNRDVSSQKISNSDDASSVRAEVYQKNKDRVNQPFNKREKGRW